MLVSQSTHVTKMGPERPIVTAPYMGPTQSSYGFTMIFNVLAIAFWMLFQSSLGKPAILLDAQWKIKKAVNCFHFSYICWIIYPGTIYKKSRKSVIHEFNQKGTSYLTIALAGALVLCVSRLSITITSDSQVPDSAWVGISCKLGIKFEEWCKINELKYTSGCLNVWSMWTQWLSGHFLLWLRRFSITMW